MALIDDEIKKACDVMAKGGVILYPTDTIWGIGCDATNDEAVKKVFEIKQRADSKALIVLVDNPVKIDFYADDVPEITKELVEVANKPLTIVYPRGKNLSSLLLSEDKSVGIRVTNEEFSKKLCFKFRKPIVSTSANISGEVAPANFSEVTDYIINSVDYVVNFRQDDFSKPAASSVIKVDDGGVIKIIRE